MFTYLKHIIVNSVAYGTFIDDESQKQNYDEIDGLLMKALKLICDEKLEISID